MKAGLFTTFILCMVLPCIQLSQQDRTASRTNKYSVCMAAIRKAPEDAYKPCRQYLEQSPFDDPKRIQYVQNWLAQYESLLPYAEYLRSLTVDQKSDWIVYEPDMLIELPQTSEEEGPYKIQIARSFADPTEEAMLRKAEAVYPGPGKMVQELFRSYCRGESPKEMTPLWGIPGNDNIQATTTVTARAVRYYYDLSLAARKNPTLPTGFTAVSTNLKYAAGIKYFNEYSHGQGTFNNVYVADLTLDWAFICGGLCGMGFTRNKVVVLDTQGNVIAMYLDAPVNSMIWVS